jgi:NAD(P)-dependent dehydrogenase (short-subunit alcohol dehydrogenase family)
MAEGERGRVVVTGASTGIGEASARRLAGAGFHVFAGVRKETDGERLAADPSGRVEAVTLDVTDRGSIAAAAEKVGAGGLAGLVNNAGVAVSGPMEFVPIDEFRNQLEVNVVGQVAVTQAFMPALRAARGRIVNISSIGGLLALPLLGPYAASKFALEGLTDSLRRELRSSGIKVALVEPGGGRTPIWDKSGAEADRLMQDAPPELDERYGTLVKKIRAEAEKIGRDGAPPDAVADAVVHALTAKRPKVRYLVGSDAKSRAALARLLPDKVMDALLARALR